jgi:hypothetical protein
VASLAASCGSDDRPGATATVAGQTVRGTGYSFSLPTGWRDTTTEVKKSHGEQVDLAADGPETKEATSSVLVIVQPSQGGTLPDLVAATRKVVKQLLSASLLGEPARLSIAGTPAMATHRLA